MLKILVVGVRSGAAKVLPGDLTNDQFAEILERQQAYSVAGAVGSYSLAIGCDDPEKLAARVTDIARSRREIVDVLDIFDHGEPGLMHLGEHHLFEFKDGELVGRGILQDLLRVLSWEARICLLGCNTAVGAKGRGLLRRMAKGTRFPLRIYGTIGRVMPVHFRDPGFSGAANLLFSSEAAVDYEAPSAQQRAKNLDKA